ncbi:hypothetical protein OIU80_00070 [Flavobacterium sp. LS1R47]|jgi:hypothetical protein|uniref:Novel toxin 16 domain-containing protein n=1 Tax=Flavobacterium frigoritolerans TaxID=2987686 RepID=A0A9X2ZL22_9FLAO|nr:type VI secretion system tube protein TssD [Flavobacterium frigoritolerans]MCV9930662.1 hypothetical protein [Flavobacterium frigoritolerans]
MTSAKLFILGIERELLWVNTNYYRFTAGDGSISSDVNGGILTVCFVSQEGDDCFMHNMTKEVEKEIERMEKGEIHFYNRGDEDSPVRKYKFRDAYLVALSETFYAFGTDNMQTVLTISPAIQDYGKELIKPWQVSWLSPNESNYYVPQREESQNIVENENPCDCTTDEKDRLQRDVTNKCKGGIMKKCTDVDNCGLLLSKEAQFRECMSARVKINTKCFKGGDAGHQLQVQQAINGMINCQNLAVQKCAPKEPKKIPVIDESLKAKISRATGLTGTALIIYIIISEGSRLFPPRNLVPIP